MFASHEDRWLLPRRQTEYPARELVSEVTLHGRREATFLVLVTLFVVSITCLVALGTERAIDINRVVAEVLPQVALPVSLTLPFGALPCALGFAAVVLACELYGRRRAGALVWAGVVTAGALVGLARLADLVDGPAGAANASLGPALALAAGMVVAHAVNLFVFDALRRRMAGRRVALRVLVASLFAQPAGWAAFGAVLYALRGPAELDPIIALAGGSAAFTFACVLVLALPVAIAARALALFLRVGRSGDDEEEAAEDDSDPELLAEGSAPDHEPRWARRQRAARASLQPYSSDELRFFTEGDHLGAD